ncbi:MAG TPA: septum formation initiator family protein [Bacteroidales bacterium]
MSLLKFFHNKYFYTLLAFVVWMIFFDTESFREQMKLSKTLDELQERKAYLQNEIEKNNNAVYILENDTAALERFAREKYYMKRDSEDVYFILREKEE